MDLKNILIVDDEADMRKVLAQRFEHKGMHVFTANTGEEAVKIAQEIHPDIILLDIMMPGMDGMTANEKLKSDTSTKDIPVVFLSAKSMMEDKIKGFNKGADDYVTKPFDFEELYARITAILEKKKRYEEMAMQDSLTGLYNRRFFDKKYAELYDIAERYGRIYSLVIIDIDNFKNINDKYGHAEGDHVLRKTAEVIKTNFRKTDIAARYGGDEFTVLMPETGQEAAQKALDNLRSILSMETAFSENKSVSYSISMSMGAGTYRKGLTKIQIFELADSIMYKEKHEKQNKSSG